jgi:hypothetical protein
MKNDETMGGAPIYQGDERPAEPLQVPELTPQDKGEPSPVPFTLMLQKPSADCNQAGVEKFHFTGAYKEIEQLTHALHTFYPDDNLSRFIAEAFNSRRAWRLEIILADWSIKVYKHPNNP